MPISPAIKQIASYSSLLAAFKRAEQNCRKSVDRARFVYQLPKNLKDMQKNLLNDSYRFGPYSQKIVIDPKRRIIHKAPFSDRCVHQAIHAYIEEGIDKRMIYHSYACRKNKGTVAAAQQVYKWTKRYDYALKLDMAKYFASIDHQRLLDKLEPVVSDKGLYRLLESLIFSFAPGIPIGSLTSQLFANWYLNDTDHFIKRQLKVKAYGRYMDDLILFSNSKVELWHWASEIKRFAQEKELLYIPARKTLLVSTKHSGVPFLGYWFFKQRSPRLQKRGLKSQKLRMRLLKSGRWQLEDYLTSSAGWWGHASYALAPGLAKDIGLECLQKLFKVKSFSDRDVGG